MLPCSMVRCAEKKKRKLLSMLVKRFHSQSRKNESCPEITNMKNISVPFDDDDGTTLLLFLTCYIGKD